MNVMGNVASVFFYLGCYVVSAFFMSRSRIVEDRKIGCWSSNPHGSQTLREAIENSCNPAFIQLGQRINSKTFYKY